MIINELLKEDPQVGDAIDLECGDVLIETVIEDITEDGIVVKLDETAMRLMMEARKQYIAESRQGVMENWGAGLSGKNDPIFTEKPLTQSALKVKKILQNFNPALYSEIKVGFGHGTDERSIKDHFKPIELALGKLPLDSEDFRGYDSLFLKVTDPRLFKTLLELYFEYLKEYRDNSIFAHAYLTPKSNQQKQGMTEGNDTGFEKGDTIKTPDGMQGKIIGFKDGALSVDFGSPHGPMSVNIQDAELVNQGVAEGSLNKNQEWDVYTVIQGNKADFKGSISAPDENSAIQAVYKDPRTYGYVSRAYAWVPFVKPKGAPLPPDIGLIYDKIVNSNLPTNTKNMLTSMITGNYPGGKDSPEQYYKTGKFSPKVQQYIDKINQQGVAEGEPERPLDPPESLFKPKRDPDEWKRDRDKPNPNLRPSQDVINAEKKAAQIRQAELEKTMKALARMRGDVEEGRVSQLPTRGADYSKYDTDHLEMLLRPGILHRNELRFKNLIRKELEKRRQAKPVDPKNLVVPLSDVPVKKPRGHKQYDPAKEFPGVFKEQDMSEAEYQGRKVPLGKPMKGDVKKSKVYVKGPKGNVVKVNFGDKNMRIKKSNPGRRKSFRARHNCDNPGPRWKARYWSCRAW